jgi:SpoIID/LytB domain protein
VSGRFARLTLVWLALVALAAPPASHASREPVRGIRVGFLRPGGGYRVETLPIDTYVARVVAGESVRGSAPAALEALAITVRTFALANLGRHRADGFDLCDQTHCQVLRPATAATERASAATSGRVLVHDGEPASIYYSASCGGRTEIPSAVWPGAADPSYLPSRRDEACEGQPSWSVDLSAGELQRALGRAGYRGRHLRDLRVVSRDVSGRVAELRLDGLSPGELTGQDLRVAVGRALGWQYIRSTAFTVAKRGDTYAFKGHGSGHGVGLCVIGSANLAADGQSAAQILSRYFPGLAIGSLTGDETAPAADAPASRPTPAAPATPSGARAVAGPRIAIALPDGDQGEQAALTALVGLARDQMAAALGLAVPLRVTVRFHATIDDYERATGRAWFTSGAIAGGELQMPPPGLLRSRGLLERAIRQDLVRLMTEPVLAGRPLWVREGAAAYFADGPPADRAVDGSPFVRPPAPDRCPRDAELARPSSVGELATAWARARVCFAHALARTGDWRRIR